jgi:hypothetical protein
VERQTPGFMLLIFELASNNWMDYIRYFFVLQAYGHPAFKGWVSAFWGSGISADG